MASSPQPQLATPSAKAHVHALQSKHAGIDAQLRDEMARPAPDTGLVQLLKKRKLRLKEAISRS